MSSKPFAVIVEAEIQPDRVDELLKIMETNAKESRKEPGCLRFGTFLMLLLRHEIRNDCRWRIRLLSSDKLIVVVVWFPMAKHI